MFWVIRGTDPKTEEDFAMVVEAQSRAAAETWAVKRNVPYIVLDEATKEDLLEARRTKRLWKHSRDDHFSCFGQPVHQGQLACLMTLGVATIAVVLRANSLAMTF